MPLNLLENSETPSQRIAALASIGLLFTATALAWLAGAQADTRLGFGAAVCVISGLLASVSQGSRWNGVTHALMVVWAGVVAYALFG